MPNDSFLRPVSHVSHNTQPLGDVSPQRASGSTTQGEHPGLKSNALHLPVQDETMQRTPALRENADKISCPFLASAYNRGELNPDPNTGTIDVQQVKDLMARVGFAEKATEFFVGAADKADPHLNEAFNLFGMMDNSLNHTGSSGVRDRGVDPERIQDILQFGENGRMYKKHFAAAARAFASNLVGEGSKFRGTAITTIEFTTVLEVFGRRDAAGKRYLTNEDIVGLWLENRFPSDWQPPPADSIGMREIMGGTLRMALRRLWISIKSVFARQG